MLCLGYSFFVYFGKTVNVVVAFRFEAEVLCEVDNFHIRWYGVLLEECLTLAVTEAEEHHIDLVEGHLRRELQVAVAIQSLVHLSHHVASVALTVGENDFSFRVVDEQTDEFAAGVSGSAQYSYSYHTILYLLGITQ